MGEANPLALTDRSSDPAMHVGKQRLNGYGTETPFIPEPPGLQETTTRNYQRRRLRSDSRPALGPPLPSQQTVQSAVAGACPPLVNVQTLPFLPTGKLGRCGVSAGSWAPGRSKKGLESSQSSTLGQR